MINDDALARVMFNSPEKCLEKCNLELNCNFWDYGMSGSGIAKRYYCRLRSNSGGGRFKIPGYTYGTRNCSLGKIVNVSVKMLI